MQSSSAEYKTAIASTDREIRGYIKFSNGFILRGSGGLVDFTVTQTAMDAERFCVGSVTSAYCNASFYNEGLDGSGVSLANASFDVYAGVVTGNPPDAETDYITETLMSRKTVILQATGIGALLSLTKAKLEALKDGDVLVFITDGGEYTGVWNASSLTATTTDGTNTYTVYCDATTTPKISVTDSNGDPVSGTIHIAFDAIEYQVEYKCLGRFYVSEITRSTATTRIVGYDIAGRLSIDYVPTVTADPDNGYLVMDILNDIIDQTGVNNGEHFTTTGDSVYVPSIVKGSCRETWGWLMTLCDTSNVFEFSGNREESSLGYMTKFYIGNGEANPFAMDDEVVYMDGLSVGDPFTITSFTTGTTDAPIVAGNGIGVVGLNPYITQAQAEAVETAIDGFTYTPATLHWRGDPCLDLMDNISVTIGENTYSTVVMKIATIFNGGLEQNITAWGDSEAYYEMSTSPTDTKINTVSNLVKEIAASIETADGGVITKILDTDGTWKELVIANNQDLDQATSVWRFNINGLAHADRYQGGSYQLAMDTQGRIVANVIQTGILQDATGRNSWNLDTGVLTITDGKIVATYNRVFHYTDYSSADYPIIEELISVGTWTDEQLAKYDVNLDGVISTADLNAIEDMVDNSTDISVALTTEIDPSKTNRPVCIYDSNMNPVTYMSANTVVAPSGSFGRLAVGVNKMRGCGYEVYSTTGTTTVALETDHTYLVTCMQRNATITSNDAVWVVSSHTNNSNIIALKSSSTTTASVSGLTLTINRGMAYSRVTWTRLA